jgi:mannose-1-phosphate guanylyltransferase
MEINALLLAAGEGMRLQPLTKHWPKCLMPIHGKPLMEYWLSDLFEINPVSIFVNTSYLSSIVEEYLSRDRFAGRIEVLKEEVLLGTGGTLLSIKDRLRDKPTLVIHGDNWCGMKISDLIDHHQKYRPAHCTITMMTFKTNTPETCGIVELDSDNVVQAFHEKMPGVHGNLANAAVYIIEPEILFWMEERDIFDFSTEVLPNFVGQIFTVHNDQFHRDIGNIESLRKSSTDPKKELIWKKNDAWLDIFIYNNIHKLLNSSK